MVPGWHARSACLIGMAKGAGADKCPLRSFPAKRARPSKKPGFWDCKTPELVLTGRSAETG